MTGWRDQAACRGLPITLFFPEQRQRTDRGRAVCRTCAVLAPCREEAEGHEAWGVWAAQTWSYGRPDVRAQAKGAYSDETRERALRLYRQLRPLRRTEHEALVEVAKLVGVGSHDTVRKWVVEQIPTDIRQPKANREYSPQQRADAIAAFEAVRNRWPSRENAIQTIAARHDVNPEALRDWVRGIGVRRRTVRTAA